MDGNGADGQSEKHAQEERTEIGLVQCANSVSQILFYVFQSLVLADHRHPVAVLQAEVVGAQQFCVATRHPTHVHAIGVAQL